MGMCGELYRVPAARLKEMLADPRQVSEEIYPDDDGLYASRRAGRGLDIDKSWDGIHFLVRALVRGGRIPWIDPVPWYAPPEGSETGATNHYGPIAFHAPEAVAKTAAALAGVTRQALESAYDPAAMMEDNIYPQTWDRPGEFEYLWEHFRALVEFYKEAETTDPAIEALTGA